PCELPREGTKENESHTYRRGGTAQERPRRLRAGRHHPGVGQGRRRREGAAAGFRRCGDPGARRGGRRLLYRATHLLRRARGAHVPPALAPDRQDPGDEAGHGAALQALLPAGSGGQGCASERKAHRRCSRLERERVTGSAATAPAAYRFEKAAWRQGLVSVAGLDEAGRGPLAGPVVAAAGVLGPRTRVAGGGHSKRVAPAEGEGRSPVMHARAVAVGVGVVDAETIDRVNILQATRRAMGLALGSLGLV